ncbi:hypothetical protein GPECTOR_33g547 [Gonium pectorale]|uniref:Protein kinase domain-containing protein n=1 Tax=Gonium pectorale TaxID=33097 RepID=A0A150GDJ8_GONPE|nr:hypothetical protein GPECTOR_33g547 [Gonium pectorale]|eukprot:KXZ47665.1 hypothetical protein GPECTOR_33g547 [Gonium pectorale]
MRFSGLQLVGEAFDELLKAHGGDTYTRINILLETVRRTLRASDARLALLSADGCWVFLAPPAPGAVGPARVAGVSANGADGSRDSTSGGTGSVAVSGGDAGGAQEGFGISPRELNLLMRLAQFLVFGVMGAPPQARMLGALTRRLSCLPESPNLHYFVAGLLHAVPELLHTRFGLTLHPVFIVCHGVAPGANAIYFARRQTKDATGSAAAAAAASWTGISSGDGSQANSSPLVRAIRVSMRQTLLAELLSSAAGQDGSLDAGQAAAAAAATASPPPAGAVHGHTDGSHSQFITKLLPNIAAHMVGEGPGCRDVLLCSNIVGGSIGSMVLCVQAVPSRSGDVEEAAEAAAAGAAAPLARAAAGDAGAEASTAPPQPWAVPVGVAGVRTSGAAHPQAFPMHTTPAARAHALQCQRQFGMYLLSPEPLPGAVLQAVADELRQLLGMILYACSVDGGPLSLGDLGSCNAELGALQQKALGLETEEVTTSGVNAAEAAPSITDGPLSASLPFGGVMDAAGTAAASTAALAAAGGSSGGGSRRPAAQGQAVPLPLLLSADRMVRSGEAARLQAPPGRPVSLSRFRRIGSLLPAGPASAASAARVRAAAAPLPGRAHSQAHLLLSRESPRAVRPAGGQGAGGAGQPEPAADGAELALQWMHFTAPEVLLESSAADASSMQTMVSSLRSGVTAALTGAMTLSSSDDRSLLAQELAAIRLSKIIGHGGQGLVLRGTFHGLETAVKVIAHKRPVAAAKGDTPAAAAGEGAAGGGGAGGGGAAAAAGVAGDGEYGLDGFQDVVGARRGAMELVVTGALSHPNIVQVLASFSEVVLARCTFRGDPQPQLRLFLRDDPVLSEQAGPPAAPNTVVCLEYCDAGTLLAAARAGAFRLPGTAAAFATIRPALVPLYTSLLEIALALRYLHARRLVHCDVKPSNVLLKSSSRDPRGWNCKLSDFGCVRLMTELPGGPGGPDPDQPGGWGGGGAPFGFKNAKPVGTVAYMAPELFVKDVALGPAVDVYAFGITMWELLMNRTPYEGYDSQALPRLVAHEHLRPEFDPLSPLEYIHLAGRCWSAHASRRPTAAQLVRELEGLLEAAQRAEEKRLARRQLVVNATTVM